MNGNLRSIEPGAGVFQAAATWLPGTHGDLYEQYKDQLVDLGPNLEGVKIGLVVPAYMDIDSIADLEAK